MIQAIGRVICQVVIPGAALGVVVAFATHGEFGAMKLVLYIGCGSALLLLLVGTVVTVGSLKGGVVIRRSAATLVVAVAVAFLAAPAVFQIDLWAMKRYVRSDLAPHLEKRRAVLGRYPHDLDLRVEPPPQAPWLARHAYYYSDGSTYHLTVTSPAVCGHSVHFSSSTGGWRHVYQDCWF